MDVVATAKYVRLSPDKVRDLTGKLKGLSASEALKVLDFSERKGAYYLAKTLKAAIANAENNAMLSREDLYVATVMADEGPRLKRWRARARGRADRILKRTSHVTVVLDTYEGAEAN